MTDKSCADCIHCHQWSYEDTREEPGDSGWECEHPVMGEAIEWCEFIDDEEAGKTAETCSYYERIDYAAIAKAEAEMEVQLAEDERLAKEYWEALTRWPSWEEIAAKPNFDFFIV